MSYESTAEPIKVGYLMDFTLAADFPKELLDSFVQSLDLVFEEVTIDNHSPLIGQTFKENALFNYQSVIVVARRRRGGELEFQPRRDSKIEEGDLLIVVGKADSVKQLVEISK